MRTVEQIVDDIIASTAIVSEDVQWLRNLLGTAAKMGAKYASPPAIVPAAAGWRLVILGPDCDEEACPIVAWQVDGADAVELLPIARVHGQDGSNVVTTWAGRLDRVVGILAPGEELDGGWVEAAEQLAKAIAEQEEREAAATQ